MRRRSNDAMGCRHCSWCRQRESPWSHWRPGICTRASCPGADYCLATCCLEVVYEETSVLVGELELGVRRSPTTISSALLFPTGGVHIGTRYSYRHAWIQTSLVRHGEPFSATCVCPFNLGCFGAKEPTVAGQVAE